MSRPSRRGAAKWGDLPDAGAPTWERRCPGRFVHELEALRAAGADPKIEPAALVKGVLAIDLEWPIADGALSLRAVYPDTFPRTRPEVYAPGLPLGRHLNPTGRNLCLLGRGTHNWRAGWTLAELLRQQLPVLLAARGATDANPAVQGEVQQGEPAEEWWNGTAPSDSYLLVDSAWTIDPAMREGRLKIRYVAAPADERPSIRAYVEEVRDAKGNVLCKWGSALPPDLRAQSTTLTIPWARHDNAPIPTLSSGLKVLAESHPSFTKSTPQPLAGAAPFNGTVRCIIYPAELGHRTYADGWLFLLLAIDRTKPKFTTIVPIRTLRAGPSDVGMRVPAAAVLRSKSIAIFGLGAIGAPMAIELARNLCGELRLIEHDIVEPGNTVRWALGAGAWGKSKLVALTTYIEAEHPATRVVALPARIGECLVPADAAFESCRSETVITRALEGVDLVIDATAEQGINWLLDDLCRERMLPLITVHATPTLAGGIVARFVRRNGQGCRLCLEHAWLDGTIPAPEGANIREDDALIQPPGCADRTFRGASFDLAELSLEAVRLAIDTLSDMERARHQSLVHTVRFLNGDGGRVPPVWEARDIPPHPSCPCHAVA